MFVYIYYAIFNKSIFYDFSRDAGVIIKSGRNIGHLSVGANHTCLRNRPLLQFGNYADHFVVGTRVLRHRRPPG